MEQQHLQQLIDKVLSGKASLQEQEELDQWYALQDEQQGLTEQLNVQEKNKLGSGLFQAIEQKLSAENIQPEEAPVYQIPVRNNSRWWIAAAVLVLLAAGSFYVFTTTKPVIASVWQEHETTNGVQEIRLPDGSRVWLNAGSSIRYDTAFSNGKREFWLRGEAYFDVAQQNNKPFEVHTARITTQVLGTAFNIDAYDTLNHISVTVNNGKVAVRSFDKVLSQLLPEERIICLADGSFKKETVVADDQNAWTSGQLVFRNMKFSEVAKRLERKFKVELIFPDASIGDCAITASFMANTSLKDILEMLALTNGSEISEGKAVNQYYITGKKQCK